jgi:riboflavin kinase/FMN adenylyltransferase
MFGSVVQARQLGRKIGFPTANLTVASDLHPPVGVYAVEAHLLASGRALPGVANLGYRPTVETGEPKIVLETHIFDFSEDIYGQEMKVQFVKRLRPEKKLPDLEALKAQIAADCRAARQILSGEILHPTPAQDDDDL